MSDLLKEALIEAKKLKEIAEEEAKKSLIEAMSPYIKNIISKQINEATDNAPLNINELDDLSNTMDTSGLDLNSNPTTGDQQVQPPIQVDSQDVVNVGMPDSSGMIVVSLEDLFSKVPAQEQAPVDSTVPPVEAQPVAGEMPAPVPEAEPVVQSPAEPAVNNIPMDQVKPEVENKLMESVSFDLWKKSLLETTEKIDRVYFSKKAPNIVTESLKNKLFSLLESLDSLKEKGKINREQVKINENKLEFLFLKLKDANLNNSYIKKDHKEEENMSSLKEYAAKLFAESFEGEETNHKTTASAKHAADVSGVDPEVKLDEEALTGSHEEKQWADGEPALEEKDQDKVIEEALNAIAEEVEPMLEMDEKEIQEAINYIKSEAAKKKAAKLKEGVKEGDQGSQKPAGGDDDAKKALNAKPGKSNLKPVEKLMAEEADPMEMDSEDDGLDDIEAELDDSSDADLVINIDLPDEVEEALADVDLSAIEDVKVSLKDLDLGDDSEEEDMEDSEEDEDMEDMEDSEEDEEVVLLTDTEEEPSEEEKEDEDSEEEMKVMMESFKKLEQKNKLLESKLVQANKNVASMKSDLQEANLFIAKNVYFTKFLQRGDLSKSNLTKIVEHLDRATTVQEAKDIYTKIKTKLAESVTASKQLNGSSSKVTSSGSPVSLNESVSNEDVILRERWQKLARINDK
jgi:hypothetical protein